MFDFAWSEFTVIAVVSVVVLGPKQLPETMRTMAKVMRRVRSLGVEFQGHVNEMVREAELEELRNQVQKISTTNVTSEVAKLVDPTGEISATIAGAEPVNSAESTPAETPAVTAVPAAPEPAPSQTSSPAPPAA